MGGCEIYGPFLGTLNIRCRIIIGIPKDYNFDSHDFDSHPYEDNGKEMETTIMDYIQLKVFG